MGVSEGFRSRILHSAWRVKSSFLLIQSAVILNGDRNGCVRAFAGNKGGSASPIVGDSGFSSNCRASEREGDHDNPATGAVDYATSSREDLIVNLSLFP